MSVKIELNHKLHVLTRKEELDSVRVAGKIVVVIDILFATTTMVAALAHGALEVIPVLDESAARAEDARRGAGACVLAGEHPRETVLLVCSGSGANFNFEDFYGAGCFVERFADRLGPAGDLSDAAR